MNALPVEAEIKKLPRQYIANVIYTLVGDPFYQWVQLKINERNEKVKQQMNINIQMDPRVAEAFRNSTAVSSKYM